MVACSNHDDLETGEIKTLQLLQVTLSQRGKQKIFLDARKILSREQIDAANVSVLFVELETGQNGTLTLYPGEGIGETWLGADGATITFEQGILKASRGMGDDVMGASSSMLSWRKLKNFSTHHRQLSYLSGNNKIQTLKLTCEINKLGNKTSTEIWGVEFKVTKYEEICLNDNFTIKNTYYLDDRLIVRKSRQFHSNTLGYIITERLER